MSPGKLLSDHGTDGSETSEGADVDQDLVDPVAIIGFALKFPQDATSSETFWRVMVEKRDTMTELPADRLNINAFYSPSRRNGLPSRGGHFIKEDLGAFDADFFSIPPAEALAMDPGQRLLLETTFKAFENAGIRLEDLRGSNTSVHTGSFTNDYLLQLLKDPDTLPTYTAVGATLSMLANRLSWFYDLCGPSVNLDSACSSSAMAIDQACQLLRAGECDMGLVAGCNLTFDPDFTNALSNMQFLSPDSRCYAFDHRANGFSRGEGVGAVVLKRLSDALRDNDTIRAIIRASGANQDGRTLGITQPSTKAQTRLIKETYRKAGLSMGHTRFFEAHGTGTAVGDPIEAGAIIESFNDFRSSSSPLYIGAVKANLGHLEGASGMAGLIKTILVLETGVIVPNANFERLNPKVDPEDSCLAFPMACILWPSCDVRRASINSFGYGGSNCHIVVDDAHSYLNQRGLPGNHHTASGTPHGSLERSLTLTKHSSLRNIEYWNSNDPFKTPKLFVWSASDDFSLEQLVIKWREYLLETLPKILEDNSIIHDLAYTLDSRRSSLQWRTCATITSVADLKDFTITKPMAAKKQQPRLAFVFTGQGAQWYSMGRDLLQYTVFSRVIEDASTYLMSLGCSWSVRGTTSNSLQNRAGN